MTSFQQYNDQEWSLWDRFEVKGEMTLRVFLDHFKTEYQLEVTTVSHGSTMIFSFFLPAAESTERMSLLLSEVVERASTKTMDPHVKALVFELCCNNFDGVRVQVPYVRYLLPTE